MLNRLLHIALTLGVIVALPLSAPDAPFIAAAWADDDGDNGDGDSDGDSDGYGNDSDDDSDDDDDDDATDDPDRPGNGSRQRGTNAGGGLLDLLFGRTPQPQAPQRAAPPPPPPPARARNEIVVLDLSQTDLATLLARGYEVIETAQIAALTIDQTTLRRLRVPQGTGLDAALEEIRLLTSGQASDFNHYYRMSEGFGSPCDGLHCNSFDLVDWSPPAEPLGGCGQPTARIGLIDTGINPDHEAFAGSRLSVLGFDAAQPDASSAQHGTAVAALLIGSREGRAHGLLPEAQLIAVDAFYRSGGDERSDVFNLVRAMDDLAAAEVDVINMSLAGPHNVLLERMVDQLSADQILIVSAAGNGGPRAAPVFPGAYDQVLTVTAVDASGRVYRRAGRGPHVDLAAPGVEVWTAASIRGVRTKTGTSFAAPFATAAAAILMSAREEMSVAEVTAFLRDTALDLGDPGPDEIYGAGLVQFAPICAASSGTAPALLD